MNHQWAESGWKRACDACVAGLGAVMLSPVLLLCALGVRLTDGPGVLFRQTRIGSGGRPFTILKFRTMHPGERGPLVTAAGDPRVTRVGRTLRRIKLDELPQLWNVVRGDMSLVGPRPEVPVYVDQHAEAYRRLGRLRPGITDWASLAFRNEEALLAAHGDRPDYYSAVVLPRKLALARLYRRHATAGLDARLVLATVCAACGLERLMHFFAGSPIRLALREQPGVPAGSRPTPPETPTP